MGILLLSGKVPAFGVMLGDSAETVRAQLGEPSGVIEVAGKRVLVYEMGKVHLQNGRVSRLELYSEKERQRREAAKRAAEARRAEQEKERTRLREEGELLMLEKLGEADFNALSAGQQLRYWQEFREQYPMVDVSSVMHSLRAEIGRQAQAREDSEERFRNLHYRVRRDYDWPLWGTVYPRPHWRDGKWRDRDSRATRPVDPAPGLSESGMFRVHIPDIEPVPGIRGVGGP